MYMFRTVTARHQESSNVHTTIGTTCMSYRFFWLLASGIRIPLASSQQNCM